ncbi:MAG: hypothetical protein B9S38_02175 [Verrucomicrobiia bacterium Tous-C4TDCM]|nr:MAG: hypothetical protein B9S38_02175 [Verrucomicrobiae bacterium Tous-C4TDCM]
MRPHSCIIAWSSPTCVAAPARRCSPCPCGSGRNFKKCCWRQSPGCNGQRGIRVSKFRIQGLTPEAEIQNSRTDPRG